MSLYQIVAPFWWHVFEQLPMLLYLLEDVGSRVESGSDDPDNVGHLGHFFDGSSGSHPQTKLSGCDPDFLVH